MEVGNKDVLWFFLEKLEVYVCSDNTQSLYAHVSFILLNYL